MYYKDIWCSMCVSIKGGIQLSLLGITISTERSPQTKEYIIISIASILKVGIHYSDSRWPDWRRNWQVYFENR